MNMFIDDWKVPPGQNRGCGPVTTRMMTSEEWAKYGPPVKRKEHDIAAVKYMVKEKAGQNRKITKEKLLEECRLLGTDRTACENIAKKYGYSHYSAVQQRIRVWGIREILKREVEKC